MRFLSVHFALCAFLFLQIPGAFASARHQRTPSSSEQESSSQTDSSPLASLKQRRVGLTTLGVYNGLSAQFDLDSRQSIQAFLGLGGTQGGVQTEIGGVYRYGIIGTQNLGLHIGGMGSVGAAFLHTSLGAGKISSSPMLLFSLAPLAGMHFPLWQGSPIHVSLDGGAMLKILDGNADLTVGPFSSLLGLSVHYLLD